MDNNEHAPSFQSLPFDSEFAGPADWARLYRARGLQVVPAFSPGESKGPWKRPLLKDWRQYQHELVADEVFLPWYGPLGQYRQRANMGVICGSCSGGLFVVDLDIYKTPAALRWWLNLLELHNARLELETVEQRTGGGGLQKLFLAPPGWTPPTCKTILGVDIRGQGGFAMLAPSVHESGKAYEWLPGRSPDEIEILTAPSWLLDTIDALVREHGGGTTSGPHVRTADTQSAHDAFGHQVDGREQFMTELVWGSIVDWRRECPIKPSAVEQRLKAMEKYEVYERQVNPRLVDPQKTKTELLEAEGRGPDAFLAKWYAAMRRWDDKVLEASKQPGKSDNYRAGAQTFDYGDEFAKTQAPGTPPPATYELLSVKDIKGMADPLWLVDGLVVDQSMGFIYGPPGCLKTFLALDMALSLASGQKLWWNRGIQRGGAVVYISSEGQADLIKRDAVADRPLPCRHRDDVPVGHIEPRDRRRRGWRGRLKLIAVVKLFFGPVIVRFTWLLRRLGDLAVPAPHGGLPFHMKR